MQIFIGYGRVASIPDYAVGKTANGHVSFKFDFACDSSLQGNDGKSLTSFFHVQVYGKQAEIMAQSLSKGSPILVKGEIVQRTYTNNHKEILVLLSLHRQQLQLIQNQWMLMNHFN